MTESFCTDTDVDIDMPSELILEDTSEVYRHFLLAKNNGIVLRPGSMIS